MKTKYSGRGNHSVNALEDMLEAALFERDEFRLELQKAIQYLREGKSMFTPNTTNSLVDDLLAKYSSVGTRE